MKKALKSIQLDFIKSWDYLEGVLKTSDNSPLNSCCSLDKPKNSLILTSDSLSQQKTQQSFIGNYIYNVHAIISCGLMSSNTLKNNQAGLKVKYDENECYRFYLTKVKNTFLLKVEGGLGTLNKQLIEQEINLKSAQLIQLKIKIESEKILFYYSVVKYRWHKLGASFTTSGIPDDDKNKVFGGMYVKAINDKTCKAYFTKFSLRQS